jgi:hypothetical protein
MCRRWRVGSSASSATTPASAAGHNGDRCDHPYDHQQADSRSIPPLCRKWCQQEGQQDERGGCSGQGPVNTAVITYVPVGEVDVVVMVIVLVLAE